MQLNIDQLENNNPLKPVYLLTGDEPFQKIIAQDTLRQQARQQGFDERRVFDFSDGNNDWSSLLEASQSLGLFASRQLIELHLGEKRPKKADSERLQLVIDQAGDSLVLLITCSRLSKGDMKAAWYKAVDKAGAVVRVWPIPHKRLPDYAQSLLAKAGLTATPEALQLLAARSEGNLLALSQEIQKLALLHADEQLDVEQIRDSVADSSHYSVFDLGEAVAEGDAQRAIHILDQLHETGEAATLLLWNLSRDLQAMEAMSLGQAPGVFLPRPQQSRLSRLANQLGNARLQAMLQTAFLIDQQIKGQVPGDPWDQMASLIVSMTGKRQALT